MNKNYLSGFPIKVSVIITFAAIQTNQVKSGAIQIQPKMLLIIANLQKRKQKKKPSPEEY